MFFLDSRMNSLKYWFACAMDLLLKNLLAHVLSWQTEYCSEDLELITIKDELLGVGISLQFSTLVAFVLAKRLQMQRLQPSQVLAGVQFESTT